MSHGVMDIHDRVMMSYLAERMATVAQRACSKTVRHPTETAEVLTLAKTSYSP